MKAGPMSEEERNKRGRSPGCDHRETGQGRAEAAEPDGMLGLIGRSGTTEGSLERLPAADPVVRRGVLDAIAVTWSPSHRSGGTYESD